MNCSVNLNNTLVKQDVNEKQNEEQETRIVEWRPAPNFAPKAPAKAQETRIVEWGSRKRFALQRNSGPQQESKVKHWLKIAAKIAVAALVIGAFAASGAIAFVAAGAAASLGAAVLLYCVGSALCICAKALCFKAYQANMYKNTNANKEDTKNFLMFALKKTIFIFFTTFAERIFSESITENNVKRPELERSIIESQYLYRFNAREAIA